MQTTSAFAVVGALLCLAATTHADPITIDQALARAVHRPSIRAHELDVDAARAAAAGARTPLYNPEVGVHVGPQFGAGWSVQGEIGISHTIERGGKRDARGLVADAEIAGGEAGRRRELAIARVETWRAFEHALVHREQLATRVEVEQLASSLAVAMQRSAVAGGTTRLRANLAAADAGRAKQERLTSEIEYATALAALASAIGAPPAEALDPSGSIAEPTVVVESLDRLVAAALANHPAIAVDASELAVARARVGDADARGITDFTLGIAYAYTPDPDGAHAIVGSISWPLGVRNENQGERAVARVGVRRAEVELDRERVDLERSIRLAFANYQRTRDAIAGFDAAVTEHLGENLRAAQEAFAKGGLEFIELTTTQRELVAARIAFLDARLAAIDAWAALALAAGLEVAS